MKPERLYRCSSCGDVITEEDWEDAIQSGGGYCYCEFRDGERILHDYDVYHLSAPTKISDVK